MGRTSPCQPEVGTGSYVTAVKRCNAAGLPRASGSLHPATTPGEVTDEETEAQ